MKRSLKFIVTLAVLVGAAFSPSIILAQDADAPSMNRSVEDWMQGANFVVGVYNVEDLLRIPGTRWIVGSGLLAYNAGFTDPVMTQNYLHLFDAEAETGRRIEPEGIVILPDMDTFPGSTPPDWEILSTHGISLSKRVGDVVTLYAVNHGGREAIEVFKIDVSRDEPRFVWVGNVTVPKDGWPDAVCALPDTHGFLVTAMSDPTDPKAAYEAQVKGAPVGWVKEWHPKTGWTKPLPGTESFSSPNGIVVSEDGSTVWVATSSGMKLHRFKRGGSDPELKTVKLDGPPDNLRWSTDGKSIFLCIHTASVEDFENAQKNAAATGGSMLTTFEVRRVNPQTLESEVYMPSAVYGALGASCSAIEVGDRLWLSSTKSDRIGVFNLAQ